MINFIKFILSLLSHILYLDNILNLLNSCKDRPLSFRVKFAKAYLTSFRNYQLELNELFKKEGL